ncbi:kinase binding protein CGI-121-domain-containing protein [Echria macrotheca]|uniref:EKC/KEOPS complex subunit CGI121 n=1 Tax=Echria macrotheca TaxID=438768 RepID=A0AAJ0B744_9PEZI|nr:kinase binding protein CGI-121-domain-containing protein [Echria macrotheca]
MSLETLEIDHIPSSHRIHAALFHDVSNTDFLHAQLLARNPDFDYTFLDASSVISRLHVLSAIYRAVTTQLEGSLTTATPHSEVVLSLSPNNNIADAYRRWGITPGKTKDIIVIKIVSGTEVPTPEDIWAHLTGAIKGTPAPLSDEEIAKATDWPKVRKYYSLNAVPALASVKDEEVRRREMERLAIMKMALRGL